MTITDLDLERFHLRSQDTMNLLEKAKSDNPEDWPKFSYSQLQTWDRCEFSWYLSYEEKWTRKATGTAMNIGLIAHKLLEIHYSQYLPGWKESEDFTTVDDELRRLVNAAMENKADSKTLDEISRAGKIVKRYISGFAPKFDVGMQVMGVEHHFEVPLKTPRGLSIVLQGYVDLMVVIQGKIWIVDHKTTQNASFWRPGEVLMDPQMTLYQYALQENMVPVHGILYNFLNSYPYKGGIDSLSNEKLFKRDPGYRTEREIINFSRQLLHQIDKIIAAASDDSHPYHRSLRRECERCQFQEPCLYGLKGIDMQPVLITKYKKKEEQPTVAPEPIEGLV